MTEADKKSEMLRNANFFSSQIENYCMAIDQVDDVFFQAKKFFNLLIEKSLKDVVFCKELNYWMQKGSTLEIKKLLCSLDCYNDDNLIDSNAFELLDSVHCVVFN